MAGDNADFGDARFAADADGSDSSGNGVDCTEGHWCRSAIGMPEEHASEFVTRRSDHMWTHFMAVLLWLQVIRPGKAALS
jgi:hypothetical protein